MTRIGESNVWQATINPTQVVTPGLDYYFSATDGQTTSTSPSVDPSANPYQITILPNEAPILIHTPITQVLQNSSAYISAFASDNTLVLADIRLFFRSIGQLLFQSVEMTHPRNGIYEATIPADVIGINGADYYIRATDDFGVSSYSGRADAPHQIPTFLNGTVVPGGVITQTHWTVANGPYYVDEDIIVNPDQTLIVDSGVEFLFAGGAGITVYGGMQATGASFLGRYPELGWDGLYLDTRSALLSITNCQITHAVRGICFENTNGLVQNTVISKEHVYADEIGILVQNNSSPQLINNQILGYSRGMIFHNPTLAQATNPSLSNIRIRNTSSTIRPENRGLEVTGAVGLSISDALLEEYDEGIIWDGMGTTNYRTTPSLSNVRIRNTSSTVRSASYGLKLIDIGSVIMENDSIGGYPNGFELQNNGLIRTSTSASLSNVRIRNSSSSVRNTGIGMKLAGAINATLAGIEIEDYDLGFHFAADSSNVRTSSSASLSNVRIRNSSSSVRNGSYGMKLEGAVLAQANGLEVDEYDYGIFYQGDGMPFDRTTPSLSNVRIRNSSSSVRTASVGI
jgi:hypothetical protein